MADDKKLAKGTLLSTTVLTTFILILVIIITRKIVLLLFIVLFFGLSIYFCYLIEQDNSVINKMGDYVDAVTHQLSSLYYSKNRLLANADVDG
jgi:hypothetical protein